MKRSSGKLLFLVKVIPLLLIVILSKSCEQDTVPIRVSEQQTLLLISLDGFAAHYLETASTPTLDSIIDSGVSARGLIPVFPSKTFPNHFTQVTGLYPENHGIVANYMFDARFNEYFSIGSESQSVREGKWYQGEPVWITARRQGLITASMFWPGSDAEIMGQLPDFYYPFNAAISINDRVAQVLKWLAMDSRPHLITLYVEQIDRAGHLYGPNSKAVRDVIGEIDYQLKLLMDGISAMNLSGKINIILVSDHGMDAISRDQVIFLDTYIDLKEVEIINWSPILEIIPKNSAEEILEQLTGVHEHLKVYQKQHTPTAWHFSKHHRITPIVALADPGWSVSSSAYYEQHRQAYQGGTHGYDPSHIAMHGIFIGSGPGFKPGTVISAVESVHLYELLCALLEIIPAENDGTPEVWDDILVIPKFRTN